jgi:RimJ/RimL family protein N-acetyltransferase
MEHSRNDPGQPIGHAVEVELPLPIPTHDEMIGTWCQLVPLTAAHAEELFAAFSEASDERDWTYLPYGPYADLGEFREWVGANETSTDPLFFGVVDDDGVCGIVSYLRITPMSASIEVGNIHLAPRLQQTVAATEAMYLMMQQAFDIGYRRYEWKCDALNAPSRAAAVRLGFSPDGVWEQATIYKGRNRDTAWFSILDRDWPPIRAEFERWLDPANFDRQGQQLTALASRRG